MDTQQQSTLASQRAIAIDDPWLTINQCAARVQVHHTTIRRMVKFGIIRHARVGTGTKKDIRVRQSWLDAGMESTATPIEVKR